MSSHQDLVAVAESTPVHLASFPPEILGDIFFACIPILGNRENLRAHFPCGLTHVCSHFRVSALAFPKLWSFLDIAQTGANQEGRSPTLLMVEAYLERSGNHPLTFRLSYNTFDKMNYQPFLECLARHSTRWENVVFESPNHYTLEYLAQSKPSDYPILHSLVFSHCGLVSDKTTLASFPWFQLSRYHEYELVWEPDCRRQWSIISQLTNVVDLRATFEEPFEGPDPIKLPNLRFASLAVSQADQIMGSFDFPGIQGLNLMLTTNQPHVLRRVPAQLKCLKILRLCGALGVAISKTTLHCLLTELTNLTDLAVELRGQRGIDAIHLFILLTRRTPGRTILVPQLQALRVTGSEPIDGTVDILLTMLRQRFGGIEGEEPARLKRFEFFLGLRPLVFGKRLPTSYTPSAMFESLESLRVHEGWDIRVVEDWQGDFWRMDMDTEFL